MAERCGINLQSHYDIEVEKDKLGPRLKREGAELKRAG